MNTFRVLNISNNLEEYPDSKLDTLEFPYLAEYVEDEQASFIYCNETGNFWKADEFFNMVNINTFSSNDFRA